MTGQTQETLALALKLDREERAVLAAHLLQSLEPDKDSIDNWTDSWEQELQARDEGLTEGHRKSIPVDDVLARVFVPPSL